MNMKKRWISTAIVLAVYLFGFCNALVLASGKNSYQVRRTVDISALTFHTTFSEAIDILRNSAEPPLKIVVLWKDLSENAYVEPDTPIKIDGVSGIRLRTGLELVLMSVYSGFAKLGYVIKGGVIIIATKESLPGKMVTRVYDISYLLSQPARFGFGFAPGLAAGRPGGAYGGQAGQMPIRGQTNPYTYGRRGRRSSTRGTMAEWGTRQGTRWTSRISNLVRDNVRSNRWR